MPIQIHSSNSKCANNVIESEMFYRAIIPNTAAPTTPATLAKAVGMAAAPVKGFGDGDVVIAGTELVGIV